MSTRDAQRVSMGLGKHFTSPIKPRDKVKKRQIVVVPGQAEKKRRLLEKAEALKRASSSVLVADPTSDDFSNDVFAAPPPEIEPLEPVENGEPIDSDDEEPEKTTQTKAKKRIMPDTSAERLFDSWNRLLPSLVEPHLRYLTQTTGSVLKHPSPFHATCKGQCVSRTVNVLCLFFDQFRHLEITMCNCESLPALLLAHGLFPTAPSQPRMAISTDLLEFYQTLFEQSCDAVHALASALQKFYSRRGFHIENSHGESISEPFRRGLGYAIQWYDCLKVLVEAQVTAALQQAEKQTERYRQIIDTEAREPAASPTNPISGNSTISTAKCSYVLQQRCPACFAGISFGLPLEEGADFHVAIDGNFHHRHQRSAGDSPFFYNPHYLLPKSFVDQVGIRIETARHGQAKEYRGLVPGEAIDDCEKTYEAADGRKQKTSMDHFDDTGLMALICRHDIPLFLANIDTPGEQQKYSVALLEYFFSLIPAQATVTAFYDVGCVLDRSLHLYDILPDSIVKRLNFATTAMHAYGHQWSCQLVYNPRLRQGLSLTDGEGVERLWSRLRKLIGITRSAGRSRRLWLLDRQARAIGMDLRDDLGLWIQRRLQKGVIKQGDKAAQALDECGIPIEELRRQWDSQRQSQTSVRAHAPARLKKELDVVLDLQGDLEVIDRALQAANTSIRSSAASQETLQVLASLERTHGRLMEKVERLYTSLHVPERFPELRGIDLDFIRTLLLARDLKIHIRKRAIGSFLEWERLDQAVGGKSQPLGTKLHQQTRNAIAKRKPALISAIRKYNKYCEMLESLHNPDWSIPVPQPLPTDLALLRDAPELIEDVWTDPCSGSVPKWLEDCDVRDGIRVMLKQDRILEEERRLGREADNLCRWFGIQLSAVELAIRIPTNAHLSRQLHYYRNRLLLLPQRWTNKLVSSLRFNSHIEASKDTASRILGASEPTPLTWISTTIPEVHDDRDTAIGPTSPDTREPHHANQPLDTNELVAADILSGEALEAETPDTANVTQILHVDLMWSPPANVPRDSDLLKDLRLTSAVQQQHAEGGNRTLLSKGGQTFKFANADIALLASPTSRLNDICINAGAALLQSLYASSNHNQFAILSTFDLPRIRCNAADADLWRNIQPQAYWSKKTWILPIHRPNHWVLCIIQTDTRELFLFDSLAAEQPWKKNIRHIMRLIARMVILANRNGKCLHLVTENWTARPVTIQPLQFNDYDCGLWVLASISAVFRGKLATGLTEQDMQAFRAELHRIVLSLPVAHS